MAEWRGRGKGRVPGQPSVPGEGGAGAGGGREGSQPTVSSSGSWTGRGKGRESGQPSMGDGGISAAPDKRSWKMKGSTASATSRSETSSIADPEGNFVFALELNGSEVAHFLECSGLKTTTEVFELQEGGMNYAVHKLPGQSKWENILLRYGVSKSTTLLGWRDQILQDSFTKESRLSGAIVVKNNQMQVVRRYNFVDAWPVSWEGPSFQASGAELAIECVELAHHGIYVS